MAMVWDRDGFALSLDGGVFGFGLSQVEDRDRSCLSATAPTCGSELALMNFLARDMAPEITARV
jgi:hypothetical protein